MDVLKELEKGNIHPVYLFCGGERYLMEEALSKIESMVVVPATKSFNYDIFQGSDITADAIIGVAQTVPMMAKKRLVVIKDADKLASSEMEILARYLKTPCPSTCMVFTAEKGDMRKGFFQALKDSTVKFEPLYENQLPPWIKKEAESKGKKITPEAVQYITEAVGNDLLKLKNEIEKAALHAGDGKEIGLRDVEAVSTKGRLRSIFDLTDAVGVKDKRKALKVLGGLLDNGENGVYILYMIARHLRQIWKVRELMDIGKRPEEMAKELGIKPFFLKGIIDQAGRFSRDDLREVFPRLLEADASLKSGKLTDRIILEQLFLTLPSPQLPPGRRWSENKGRV